MIIKHGKGAILDIVKDADHNIDDDLTRKAMINAAKKEDEDKAESAKNEPVKLEN
jgi:hypothetical protein